MFPVSTLTGVSATGDLVTGPGFPLKLINGMPVACMGDAVAGVTVTGVISTTMHPTLIIGGRPVASLTCMVTGVNPVTGIPMTTPEAVTVGVNIIV